MKGCVFPCKVAAAGDERYLVGAAGAAAVVSAANVFLLCVLQRSSMRVLNLWLQIAVGWLRTSRRNAESAGMRTVPHNECDLTRAT